MALITVTTLTEYGEATVRDMVTGVKSVTVRRVRVGTIAPLTNGKFYAVPVVGPTFVARTLNAATEWVASVYGDAHRWTS